MSVTLGPYTFARGEIIPASRQYSSPEEVAKSEDGVVYVAGGNYDEEIIHVKIIDSKSAVDDLIAWIRNGVRYAMNTFSFVDGYGTTRVVRYWGRQTIRQRIIGTEVVEIEIPLRVEVS